MNTLEDMKREKLPIIIFGASIVGEILHKVCYNAGINIECFTDNNLNKAKSSKYGIEVVHTSNLKEKYKDAVFLISSADIKDITNQLKELGFSKWYTSSLVLKNFDASQHQFSIKNDFVKYAVDTCLLCHENYLNPDKLFLRSVDVIITERCSLKCRDCSNLMQYYQKPKNCDNNEIKKSIDVFCNIIDEINEFRVIGGEPFMNKDFNLITKRLLEEPKVKRIVVYTNGTIVPKDDKVECLKNEKTLIFITDYGKLSRNLNNLTEKLSDKNINFYVQKAQGWTDCSKIEKHYRNNKQQREIFKNCCAKNTFTISDGKLYRCPFSANANRLSAIPDFKGDYIDFFKESQRNTNVYKVKDKIKEYILEKKFLETCDFCNGRSFKDSEIEPAIQIDNPLEYKKYK